MVTNPTKDEFKKWVSASDAMTLASAAFNGKTHGAEAILTRVSVGRILVACETGHWKGSGRDPVFHTIVPGVWVTDSSARNHSDIFWKTGDVEARENSSLRDTRLVQLCGVKFDPVGFADLIGSVEATPADTEAPPPLPQLDRRSFPPLSEAEMKRFAELYVAIWTTQAREERARDAALACYPENNVPRDRFRELFRECREKIGPINPGRPRARGEPTAK